MRSAMLQLTFVPGENVLMREVEGEAVLLDLDSGTYYGLNPVGTRIWQLIEAHGRLEAVLEGLHREYEATPDELERDLLAFVDRLAEARLGRML
jgi:hypothetical protein